jgi:hypothetical protein
VGLEMILQMCRLKCKKQNKLHNYKNMQ